MRATVRGSYRQEGILVIREGARLQCSTPGCVLTIRNIRCVCVCVFVCVRVRECLTVKFVRALVMKTSSSILADRVVVEVPQVTSPMLLQC